MSTDEQNQERKKLKPQEGHAVIAYPLCPKSLSDNIYVLIESSSWPPVSYPGASTLTTRRRDS